MKKIVISLIFLVVVTLIGTLFFINRFSSVKKQVNDTVFDFKPATTLNSLSDTLEKNGLIDSAYLFKLWVKIFDDYSKYQSGKYRFKDKISFKDISLKFSSGNTYTAIVLTIVVPEGFNSFKLAERLSAYNLGKKSEILSLMKNKDFLKSLGIRSKSIEGYLYPSTYTYSSTPTVKKVLKDMVDNFWKNLPAHYEEDVKTLGLSLNQAITFASLVEVETFDNDEMPKVAEVIWNRLKKGETLGIDAAVIYGIENYDGNIRAKHLKDKKNLYNTRIHRGLPPSPISSPSRQALLSVLNPTHEGYYYFVVDTNDPRKHIFTKTLKDHNKLVKKLVEKTSNGKVLRRN